MIRLNAACWKVFLANWTRAYVQNFLWKMLQAFYHAEFLTSTFLRDFS